MIEAKYFTKDEWKDLSKNAHESVFNQMWNPDMERIDYAMLLIKDEDPIAYVTLKEQSPNHIYLQYGGAFGPFKGTRTSFGAFVKMVDELKKKYKKISTLVENNNWGMLKFYWTEKFLVTGIRYFKKSVLLELTFEGLSS